MREQKVLPKEFEFYFPDLDNLILVETLEDGGVRIRVTRDNLEEKRKVFFIRQLAAEGFIPDNYQWFSASTANSLRVTWLKDYSWVKVHATVKRRANRAMCLIFAASCIFWLAMMRVMIVSVPPTHPASNPLLKTPASAALVPQDPTVGRVGNSLISRQPRTELKPEH
jgi:hypothetical protein